MLFISFADTPMPLPISPFRFSPMLSPLCHAIIAALYSMLSPPFQLIFAHHPAMR
jgi:hypothetical protein